MLDFVVLEANRPVEEKLLQLGRRDRFELFYFNSNMATPRNTRIALSEIPDRLEQLRMVTTPSNQRADEPTPANILNLNVFDDNFRNISFRQNFLNIASPDEIVIRQRGRRRFTLTWSPDKSAQNPFQNTPTKTVTHMTLRSSPRKRLLMTESPLKCSADQIQKFSAASHGCRALGNTVVNVKKQKLDEKPIAQTNFNTNLQVLLQGLSHNQLIEMIGNLITRDSSLEGEIRAEFPVPDIRYMEDELLRSKRNIFKSLPTSRLCKKTDSTAYGKAAIHLVVFKEAIVSHTQKLYDSSHWDALLDYVFLAWNYVRATPVWDNVSHNTIRRHCFKVLTCHSVAALKYGGIRLGVERLHNLERNLKEWSKDHEDVLSCVNALNKALSQYRTSI